MFALITFFLSSVLAVTYQVRTGYSTSWCDSTTKVEQYFFPNATCQPLGCVYDFGGPATVACSNTIPSTPAGYLTVTFYDTVDCSGPIARTYSGLKDQCLVKNGATQSMTWSCAPGGGVKTVQVTGVTCTGSVVVEGTKLYGCHRDGASGSSLVTDCPPSVTTTSPSVASSLIAGVFALVVMAIVM